MAKHYRRWGLVGAFVVILAVLLFKGIGKNAARPDDIAIRFVGYTNQPGNYLRFALLSVANNSAYTIRWHGDWVEIEGSPDRKGRTVNASLPGYTYGPLLKAGQTLTLAVGEPSEAGRWRLDMSFSRYTWRKRWLDFSFRHKLSLGLRLVDSQQLLDPTNHVTASSGWLAK
ncbi:MAG TPA: hypothetical protein VNU68_05935 [Verrucomicrobiae bacterium]|nr:hypothetical protein [Verrucomicrobiae bacterium]